MCVQGCVMQHCIQLRQHTCCMLTSWLMRADLLISLMLQGVLCETSSFHTSFVLVRMMLYLSGIFIYTMKFNAKICLSACRRNINLLTSHCFLSVWKPCEENKYFFKYPHPYPKHLSCLSLIYNYNVFVKNMTDWLWDAKPGKQDFIPSVLLTSSIFNLLEGFFTCLSPTH